MMMMMIIIIIIIIITIIITIIMNNNIVLMHIRTFPQEFGSPKKGFTKWEVNIICLLQLW